jgi:Family of unknown function (DUF5706)
MMPDTAQQLPQATRMGGAELELRLDQAWRVLALDQELIRSADLRAYLLSFMSTMLVTFVANNLDKMLKQGMLPLVLVTVFFVSAMVFFFFALTTLTARTMAAPRENGFVFFGDIAGRHDEAKYVAECRATDMNALYDDICRQTHHVAIIAKKKYATYRFAWFAVLIEIGSFLALQIAIALTR